MFRRACRVLCLSTLMIAFGGCSEPSSSQVVTGQVSYKGQPLTSGALAFYPTEGRPVQTTIRSDGGYEAELPPGEYQVTVIVGVDLPPGWKEGDPLPPVSVKLPAAYGSRVRTPLKASVAEGQSDPIDFTL